MSELKKTVLHKLIDDLKVIHSRNIRLTEKGLIEMLENSLEAESEQIGDAFISGCLYERNKFPIFPESVMKFINNTYEKYEGE